MSPSRQELLLLAHLGAQRAILLRLLVLTLLREPDPLGTVRLVRELFRDHPVQPPAESGLDPAVSDLLAGMADEEVERIMGEVEAHLRRRLAA